MTYRNKILVPDAKRMLDNMKSEVYSSLGIDNYSVLDKGTLTSRENGSIGGQMVKRMIREYQESHK